MLNKSIIMLINNKFIYIYKQMMTVANNQYYRKGDSQGIILQHYFCELV